MCPMKWLKRWMTRTLPLLAPVGLKFITANVDRDAPGILMLWFASAQSAGSIFLIHESCGS